MLEQELIPGWPADPNTAEMSYWLSLSAANPEEVADAAVGGYTASTRLNHARFVAASTLKSKISPSNLREALRMTNPDRLIWLASYKEEYDGLIEQDTYDEIDEATTLILISLQAKKHPAELNPPLDSGATQEKNPSLLGQLLNLDAQPP